jgi:tetratricopeptide (TPR) repeat protein
MVFMRRLCLAALLVSVGCASAPVRKQDQVALAAADALVLQGCYDCLLDARATYERVAVGRARPLVVTRLFETDLLIALREKELALDWSDALGRARTLASSLPDGIEAPRYLDLVEAIPPDATGWPRREMGQRPRLSQEFVARLDGEFGWLEGGALGAPVRQYLALTLGCAFPVRRTPPGQPAPTRSTALLQVPPDAPPLLRYRAAICPVHDSSLEQVRAQVPKFVEASYFRARLAVAVAQKAGPGKGRELLTDVYERFPKSPSVTYLYGSFNQLIGDCRAALRYYDETIAIKNVHEDALLGRAMCLTFLKRTDDAIAAATVIVDLRLDNVALGYYWRAWNRHFKKELDLARTDITSAKALRSRADIFLLAGIIEYDQKDLNPALKDLTAALDMERESCSAMWYLGLVHMDLKNFAQSGGHFESAMGCYEMRVVASEASLKEMQAREDLDAEFKARQIAGFEAAIKEDRSQYHASAFNAANLYAQAGNLEKTKTLIEIAARDPALADMVSQLRKIIGGR